MRKSVNLVCATLSVITIAGVTLWYFYTLRPRQDYEAARAWMASVQATYLPGYHMVLPGVDFSTADGGKLKADDLSKLAGIRYLGRVRLSNVDSGDEHARVLARLPNLELSWLIFENVRLTGRGFAELANNRLHQCRKGALEIEFIRMNIAPTALRQMTGLPCPLHLTFADMPVSVDLLQALGGFQKLQGLHLRRVGHIDADRMAALAQLQNVYTITLVGGSVGPELARLNGHSRLQILNLRRVEVDLRGLERLSDLPRLRQLDLRGTNIGDVSMEHIARIPSLASLNIAYTKVTDSGFSKLASSHALRIVFVRGTPISEHAKNSLLALRPGLRIESQWNAD